MARPASEDPGQAGPRRARFRERHAAPDGGRDQEARLHPPRALARRIPARRHRAARVHSRAVRGRAAQREPHLEARAHRPAPFFGDRQCLLRRDPPPRQALARAADAEADGRAGAEALRGDAGGADRVDRAPSRGRGRRVPRKGHRLPARDGGAREIQEAVPRLRHVGPAHRLRRQRDQLLPALPDGRQAALRPQPRAPAARRLAAHHRRAGRAA